MAKQLNVNLAFNAETGQAKAKIQELQSLLNSIAYTGTTTTATGKLQKDLQQASAAAKDLQFHLNNAFNSTTGKFDLSLLDKSLRTSKQNISELSSQLLQSGATGQQAFLKLAQSISMADQPMLRISNRVREFGTVLKNTIKWQLSSSMIHGFIGAINSAYGYAQDLNASLNDIRIVTGQSTEQMAKFAVEANKAAKVLSTTTTDYTKASLIYYQQGLSDSEVAKRTEVTIKMANAAGQSAQVVSDQLTAVWNNFYDGSKSLEYYADVMTALGAATASSTDEISQGLQKFAAVAETVGLSYEYATAALATITSNTRESADVVGTALKTLFARIQGLQLGETLEDGTNLNKYSQALSKIGISIYEQNGELKAMDNILNEMAAKWGTLNSAQQTALAQTVAGVRQYTQLVALMENWNNGDGDSFQANLNTALNSEGALSKQADIYAESWEAAEKQVKASAESIFQNLLNDKFFISVNKGLSNLLDGINSFIEGLGGVKPLIGGIASLFLMNFAHKIPQALENLKYNFQMLLPGSTQKAYSKISSDMNAATQKAFKEQKIDANSSTGYAIQQANELTAARSKLALVSGQMSDVEKQAAETQLSLIASEQEAIIALKQKNEELEKSILLRAKSMQVSTGEAYQTGNEQGNRQARKINFEDLGLSDQTDLGAMGGEMYEALAIKISQSMQEAKNSGKDFTEATIANFDLIKASGPEVSNAFDNIKAKIDSLDDNADISNLKSSIQDFINVLPPGVKNIDALKQALNNLKQSGTKNELLTSFTNLLNILQSLNADASSLGPIIQSILKTNGATLYNDMMQLANNTTEANNRAEILKNTLNGFQPQHTIRMSEALGKLAGMAGSTAMAFRGIGSAFSALSNPDLSGWEKFLSVLTAISMVIPAMISIFTTLKTLMSQETVVKIANAAATLAQAAAEKKLNTEKSSSKKITAKNIKETIQDTKKKLQNSAKNRADAWNQGVWDKLDDKTKNAYIDKAMRKRGYTPTSRGNGWKLGSNKSSAVAAKAGVAPDAAAQAEAMGMAGKSAFTSMAGGAALVAAGVAVAVGAVAWGVHQFNKQAKAADEAAVAAGKAAEAYEQVSQTYQQFNNSVSNYDNAKKQLDGLTRGTLEYRDAVLSANAAAMDLVNTYDGLTYTTDAKTGLITIDEKSMESVKEQQLDRVQNAQMANQIAAQNARDKALESEKTNFARDEIKSTSGTWANIGNVFAATAAGAGSGALIGAGLGLLGGPFAALTSTIGAIGGAIIGGIAGLTTGIISVVEAGSASEREEAALEQLGEIYAKEGDKRFQDDETFEKMLREDLKLDDEKLIASLVANRESTAALAEQMANNAAQERAKNEQAVATEYGEEISKKVSDENVAKAVNAAMGAQLGSRAEELYETKYKDGKGIKDKDIQKAYAEAMGWNVNKIDNLNKNKATYYDSKGNKVAESLDDETARRFLAQQEAMKELGVNMTTYINTVQELMSAGKGLGDNVGNGLLNFSGGGSGDLSGLTQSEFANMQKDGMLSGFDEASQSFTFNGITFNDEKAKAMGYANAKAFYDAFTKEMETVQAAWDTMDTSFMKSAGLDSSIVDNMSLSTAQSITSALENINLGPLGEAGGQEFIQGLNKMISSGDLNAEEQQKALAQLANIDWSSWDAMEQAEAIMKSFGVEIDSTSDEWIAFTENMRIASGAAPDYSKLKADLNEITSILNNLDFGKVISEEDYQRLVQYNDEWERFFILQADGSRKFIGDSSEMQRQTQNNIREQRQQLEERKSVQQNFANAGWAINGNTDIDWSQYTGTTEGSWNTATSLANSSSGKAVLNILGYDPQKVLEQIEAAKSGNEEAQKWLDEMFNRIEAFENEDLDLAGEELSEMMASTATNFTELNQLMANGEISPEAYSKQFSYLSRTMMEGASSLAQLNDAWRQIQEINPTADYDIYAQNLIRLASEYGNCAQEIEKYQRAVASGNEQAIKVAEDELRAATLIGEASSKYGLNAEALEIQAKQYQILYKDMNLSAEAAANLAIQNQRMNKGLEKLEKGWKDYSKALKATDKSTMAYAEAAAEVTEIIKDLVGAGEDLELSDEFLKSAENLELLEKAAKKDEKAINALGVAVAKDLVKQMEMINSDKWSAGYGSVINGVIKTLSDGSVYKISEQQFASYKSTVMKGLEGLQQAVLDGSVKAGDTLSSIGGVSAASWAQSLNQMALATNMSVEQMNSMLSSMGVQANVEVADVKQKVNVPVYETTSEVVSSGKSEGGFPVETIRTKTVQIGSEEMDGVVQVAQISMGEDGKSPNIQYTGSGGTGGGGSSGGGGGGGGGDSKPKKAEKVKKTEIVTRYKEVDDSLDDIADTLTEIEELNDRLYGADKLKQMQKVNDLLREEIELNKQKKQEAQQYLDLDRKELQQAAAEAGVTFEFDDNGNISNYTEQMTKLYEEIDSAIESANADGNADEDEQEYIDNIQEKIDKVTEALEQYEETRELITDLDAEMRDKLNEIYDNEIEAFQYKVELDLELSDDALAIIEFQLGQIEDDAFKAAESIALTSKQAETLYDKLMTSRTALDEAFGLSDIAWDLGLLEEGQEFTEAQIDLMKEYRDNIMDVIGEMSELRETVEEQVMEVFEAWNDKLETNMDTLDHFGSMLDSYKNIVDIVGQDTMGLSEGFMQGIQEASVEHALDQMHATKEAYETMMSARLRAEQALEDARARGDDASAKMWEETLTELNSNMESAQEDMLSSWEDALSVIQDNFEATVERVVETFNNAVYAFGGMEGLSNEFSRQKEMADLMVDDYQKIYELSKLNRNIQKTLDDTDVIAGKQKLLKLQEKINALEEEGVELSQYDLEYLQAEYELRMAEIELANAQAKKDTVRLSKDNEGNWSYIYTTSVDAVDEAHQKYEDALYAMQELSSNYVDEMSEQLISTSQEMAEALAEVRASDFASQEDYEKELDRIRKMYQERLDQQEAELQKSINNNKDLYTQDWTNYHEATGYKISDTENFVTSFKDSMLGTLMQSESDTANFNNIMSSAVDILTTGLVDAATTYYLHMEQAMQAAGTSTNDFAADMQENIDTVVQKSEEGAAAIEDMAEKMASAFWDISDSVNQWQEGYGSAMQQVIDSNLAVVESFNNMLKELSIDPDAIKVEYDISTDYGLENASSMDTGGYTGTWGAAGKLAILHEKELVLNPDDTSNFLRAIGISKTLLETIDLNAKQASNGMGLLSAAGFRDSSNGTLEQNVHIEATFPNVTDHNEIEEAMKNLVNTASQYANRK